MPTVKIQVSEQVAYLREVEMTDADYREWNDKLKLSGREHDRAVELLACRFIRRDDRDYYDADDLELVEFKTVKTEAGAVTND